LKNRQLIKGKHLAKSNPPNCKMHMIPAKPGTCEQCAVDHEKEFPHNAQSLFYQYHFYNETGRWPDWKDAMAHCTKEMKAQWMTQLTESGVDVEGGRVNPS